ncbi:hypothetical protein PHMEG_00019880 [Phytophthora megakarya]|uniref:PiggyBac transposable element-derived protein domain-containing protein n=1 Tax=Phytophthora megakarya TaxID=4795 RepID=A0A225VRD7_9STRA|nr:hypothetical protein PHMEG_00019880 [Phytophthora megakarya]
MPKNIPRGTLRLDKAHDYPETVAACWMDKQPVYFIATGCATDPTVLKQRERGSTVQLQVPAPQLAKDYQDYMGGTDRHDQLRLQRFLIQMVVQLKQYYHAIFLGLVDIAIVNICILYKQIYATRFPKKSVPEHYAFLEDLQAILLAAAPSDFEGNLSV